MRDERAQPQGVFRRMAWVPDLDSIHTLVDKCRDPISSTRMGRMGKNRQTARAVNQSDRIADGQSILPNVRSFPISKIAVECIAEINSPSFGDHGPRNMRPTNRGAGRLFQHRGEFDANAELIEARHDPLCPRVAHLPQFDELGLHIPSIRQMKSQNMSLHIPLDRTQLNPRHDTHSKLGAGHRGFTDSVESVMIGQGDRGESDTFGLTDDSRRRARPIGRCRVRVKVDERAIAIAAWLRRGHAE